MQFSTWTAKTGADAVRDLATNATRGLSAKDAEERLVRYGSNSLHEQSVRWWQILWRQFTSPFIYLLVGASVLALFLGEGIDGLMILLFVLINALLGFYQEFRSEQTVKLLSAFVQRKSRVLRDGKEVLIDSTAVVPGDLLVVAPGDVVSADVRWISQDALAIDESILTGESVSVQKIGNALPTPVGEAYQAVNIGFSGTTVVSGRGIGVVFATGRRTMIGDIARLTGETAHVSSFEKGIRKFSTFILRLIIVTLVFVFIANIVIKGEGADIAELVIFSIALAVSVIPEALPVVTTFSLSRGALNLAKNKVVVKRLSAIEDLGSVEVLCTDKTGTLTENVLTVADVYAHRSTPALTYAASATAALYHAGQQLTEPFDAAIARALTRDQRELIAHSRLLHEIPFTPELRRNMVVIESPRGKELVSRGATEEILRKCAGIDHIDRREIEQWAAIQGGRGRRVIAVAFRSVENQLPEHIQDAERDLTLAGLVAFVDPLKDTTIEAVQSAKQLGVRVKILTGDSPDVSGAVGYQIGLTTSSDQVITGEELDALSIAEQHRAVDTYAVFARVSPQQKYKIIQLLEEKFEVGFLGEGINDAPALKIANVALVVNDAADIAREAADIVLLKKSLKVIIDGVREGRQVFANTMKYIKATLTSNFGNFYAVAVASLLIPFLPMLPLQILLLNLLSDFPMIAIAADTVDAEELRRPRHYQIRDIALLATLLGVVSSVFDFIYFGLFFRISPEVLQTNWFIGSIITELLLLFSIRTRFFFAKARRPAGVVIWLSGVAFVLTVLVPFLPFGREVFHFTRPTTQHLIVILGVALTYFATTEIVKLLYYRMFQKKATAIQS